MARTNKMGILKKKQQQAKQKQLLGGGGDTVDGIKRSYENPKGHEYVWFLRAGKWVCDTTSVREDPDGYRLQRTPNSGETQFVHRGSSSRGYRKYLKKASKIARK